MDKNKQQTIRPGLYLISTPIGNMQDITFRAINILEKSDIVLCEDTRRSSKIFSHFNIKKKFISYHKFNEKKASREIIEFLKNNKIVSIISDAGTPTISDPGLILVNRCIEEKINIFPIPGPSSITSAISVSGFSDRFLFYGFLSKKENEINSVLKNLSSLDYSIVFFISAQKINYYMKFFKIHFANRKILIAKEMTKLHEEFFRGDLKTIKYFNPNIKGELTVVLSKKIDNKYNKNIIEESVKKDIKKMLKKYSLKDVVEYISKKENLSKKIVYSYCLEIK